MTDRHADIELTEQGGHTEITTTAERAHIVAGQRTHRRARAERETGREITASGIVFE